MAHVFRVPAYLKAPQLYRPRRQKKWTPSLFDPATEQQVTIGTLSTLSPLYGNTPAVTSGDLWILPLVTSPGGYAITPQTDGTFSYDAGGNQSRQIIVMKVWDDSEGSYFETEEAGDYFTVYVNNASPVEVQPVGDIQTYSNILISPIIFADRISDADDQDESLVYDLTAVPGLELQLVTYNAGTPGARTVWQYQGTRTTSSNITVSGTVTDPAGAELAITPFTLLGGAGVQIPPNLNNQNYLVVQELLANLGLNLIQITIEDTGALTGSVISHTPSYPTYVIPGATVSLTVAGVTDPEGEVVIPPSQTPKRSYWAAKRARYEEIV